jgi:hypothetical protein
MNKYYAVLGLPSTASKEEVRKKYRQLVLLWHPDKNASPGAAEKFVQITEAYDILMGERPAPRAKATSYSTSYKPPQPKSPAEQRRAARAERHEMLRRKFENIRQQHLRAPDAEKRREAYYIKSTCYFILAGGVVLLAIVLPLTILEPANLIWSIPVSIGGGLRWMWTGGRIKMRADMIYSGRTDYTPEDLAEFFQPGSMGFND